MKSTVVTSSPAGTGKPINQVATASTAPPAAATAPGTGTTKPAATPVTDAPVIEKPKPAPVVMVPVVLQGPYPFEVFDGQKSISAPSTSHDVNVSAGRSIRLVAPGFLLNQTVRVDGSPTKPFELTLPGPGTLSVRSNQGNCEVVIGSHNLGSPPISPMKVAAGNYKIDLVCGGQVAKSEFATISAGQPYIARLQ